MTTDLVTVSPEETARNIKDLFNQNSFHHLPVTDKGGLLIGIISKEDFFKVAYVLSLSTTGRTWSEGAYKALRARDFMTKYPLTLDPDDSIGLAADIFLANKFHALPIVEDDQLVGLVTSHDLLRFSFNAVVPEEDIEVYNE